MKHLRLAIAIICLFAAVPSGVTVRADDTVREPNYPLAARWTVSNFNKLVFDVQVTPHCLEFSDRFWYSYETRDGKRYILVDPSSLAPARDSPEQRRRAAAAPRAGAAKTAPRAVKHLLFDNTR